MSRSLKKGSGDYFKYDDKIVVKDAEHQIRKVSSELEPMKLK